MPADVIVIDPAALSRHDSEANTHLLWREQLADWCIHKVLMLVKLPALFLDAGCERLERWPDQNASAPLAETDIAALPIAA